MPTTFENFGRNVRFTPQAVLTPRDISGVLACLEQHRGRNIRVIGRLHSWSETAAGDDVVLDLRKLTGVLVRVAENGAPYADIEAGCTVDEALAQVKAHGGYTLPAYGVVGRQTIAGAIATATHGAGRPSMSHYVRAVTVAGYDAETGRARIFECSSGDALLAARCSLGCLGVVMSVRMALEPDYLIEERTRWFERLDQVVSQERDYPRQQFYLVPWSWRWYAQLRRERPLAEGGASPIWLGWNRAFRLMGADVMLNGAVRVLSMTPGRDRAVRWFFRYAFPAVARTGMNVTDRADIVLKMRHDLYRHIEMELFVPAPRLAEAAALVEWSLRTCGGEELSRPQGVGDAAASALARLIDLKGSYVHDYPITFRRVLRDETLVSMTSGEHDAWYAISLLTYQRDHGPFFRVAAALAEALCAAYGARLHWGKHCPLDKKQTATLYSGLGRFRAQCAAFDPAGVFVNPFARRVLGL